MLLFFIFLFFIVMGSKNTRNYIESTSFITKCPFCDNNNWITWHHVGCPILYNQTIDIKGNIKCDCNSKFNILDAEFNCGNEEHIKKHGDKYVGFTRKNEIRKISVMIGKMQNCSTNFEDTLIDNVLVEWEKRKIY